MTHALNRAQALAAPSVSTPQRYAVASRVDGNYTPVAPRALRGSGQPTAQKPSLSLTDRGNSPDVPAGWPASFLAGFGRPSYKKSRGPSCMDATADAMA